VERDDTLSLSTWTRNRLLQRELRTTEQILASIESGQLADIGPKALGESRRLVGLDPPLPPIAIGAACPRCGGDSGYRIHMHLSQSREYSWRGQLDRVTSEQVKKQSLMICRDCDARLPQTAPHRRGNHLASTR